MPFTMSTPLLLHHPATTSHAEARRLIFESVFPPNTAASLPTPLATPNVSFVQTTTSSHGYNTRHHPTSPPAVDPAASVNLLPSPALVLAKESRAWHLATTFLSFDNQQFPATTREWIETKAEPVGDVGEAIKYLLLNNEDGNVDGRENLIEWYVCEVRRHFLECVKQNCKIPESYENPPEILENILAKLTTAQRIYLYQLKRWLLISHIEGSVRRTPRKSRKKLHNDGDVIEDNDPRVKLFKKSLNSIISYSLPDPVWSDLVYRVMVQLCGLAVGLDENEDSDDEEEEGEEEEEIRSEGGSTIVMEDDDAIYDTIPQSFRTETDVDGDILVATDDGQAIIPEEMDGISDFSQFKNQTRGVREDARKKVLELWESLETIGVGGGGRRGEKVFAEVINTLITTYIYKSFNHRWVSPSNASQSLEDWIENVLGRLIVDVLFSFTVKGESRDARLDKLSPRESLRASRQSLDKRRMGGMEIDDGAGAGDEEQKRRLEDLGIWKNIAMRRLGRMRVSELFDIVVDWPHSLGGIEDLKTYINSPPTRLHLITTFTAAINQRILHPAAATGDVLSAYIRLIRAFTVLDTRGVLLDRVSRGIRQYLRSRTDTIETVISGIMSEPLEGTTEDVQEISDLANELSKGVPALAAASEGLEELDFDDMAWVPDPVDAGPEYKRSKGLDVVGSLFSLYETREPWMKQVQVVLTKRLLSEPAYQFQDEERILEFLKLRCDDALTQGSDIMLKDMADSKRVDGLIRDLQKLHLRDPYDLSYEEAVELHGKIVSRLYWPNLKSEQFTLPAEVDALMERYRTGFESLKTKRKLDWIVCEGVVEVELELTDRIIYVDNATPAAATIIDLFNNPDSDVDPDTNDFMLSFAELLEQSCMTEATLRTALKFWVEKDVLREDHPGEFRVIEILESRPPTPTHAATEAEQEPDLTVEDETKQQEKLVVEQFVKGMLTNGGAMPVDRIHMMLGMLVPTGYSWSMEELGEYLLDMHKRDVIEAQGSMWKVLAS